MKRIEPPESRPSQSRLGGRSARIRAAVFEATRRLLQEHGPHGFGLADVAEAADVAPSSLYRRWGGIEALITEVSLDGLRQDYPVPDTGTLRGDLTAWAENIVRSLGEPATSTFFRTLVGTSFAKGKTAATRTQAIRQRNHDLENIVKRARERGERAPEPALLVDVILAPLYIRTLFGQPLDVAYAKQLVERLLSLLGVALDLPDKQERENVRGERDI